MGSFNLLMKEVYNTIDVTFDFFLKSKGYEESGDLYEIERFHRAKIFSEFSIFVFIQDFKTMMSPHRLRN